MAIRNIIAMGVGFDPGNTEWMVTYGFGLVSVIPSVPGLEYTMPRNRIDYTMRDNQVDYTMPTHRLEYTMRE